MLVFAVIGFFKPCRPEMLSSDQSHAEANIVTAPARIFEEATRHPADPAVQGVPVAATTHAQRAT